MKRQAIFPALLVVLCCAAMLAVDGLWQPGYWVKSGVKLLLFLALPLLAGLFRPDISPGSLFRPSRRGILRAALLGIGVYAVILGSYLLLRGVVDFSPILANLPEGVTRTTFPFVALYISFVNSLLEEFFFRGFLFTNLQQLSTRRFAHGFSAVTFAAYHVAMMLGWFSLPLFLLVMAGLTVGGLIFNYLNQRLGTVYISWLVHMCANFAINTIGFILLK